MCHMLYFFLIIISYNLFKINVIISGISCNNCHIACKISLKTRNKNQILLFHGVFVGVDMRDVEGVNHKTVVQIVVIQSILETLLIKS